jgi:hypothetical protein
VRQSPVTVHVTIPLFEESIMIGSPSSGRVTSQSAQSRDWDARATEVIAEARPLGQRRSDAPGEAGRLRIAAEMKRWLSTK